MRIQHNIAALNAYRNLTNNNSAVSKNLEKLSSGYRINRAGDDAAGLAISEKMRAQITGLKTAQKNANDGISLVQTAEGALTEVHSMLNRMVELANQSANGTYANAPDRKNLQAEIDSLMDEINRISEATNFNGINLLDGSLGLDTKTFTNITTTEEQQAQQMDGKALGVTNLQHSGAGVTAVKPYFEIDLKDVSFKVENSSATAGTVAWGLSVGGSEITFATAVTAGSAFAAATLATAATANNTVTMNATQIGAALNNMYAKIGNDVFQMTTSGTKVQFTYKGKIDGSNYKADTNGDTVTTATFNPNQTITFTPTGDANATPTSAGGRVDCNMINVTDPVAGQAPVRTGFRLTIDEAIINGGELKIGNTTFKFDKNSTATVASGAAAASEVTIGIKGKSGSDLVKYVTEQMSHAKLTMNAEDSASTATFDFNIGRVEGNDATIEFEEAVPATGKPYANFSTEYVQSQISQSRGHQNATSSVTIDTTPTMGQSIKFGDTTYVFGGKDSADGKVKGVAIGNSAADAAANLAAKIGGTASASGNTVTVTAPSATPNEVGKFGSAGLMLQIGDTSDDYNRMTVDVRDMSAEALKIADIDISTQGGAQMAVDKIKDAINAVSSQRGDLGAIQNRLEHTINNLSVTAENMTAAESRIRDVDMAEEMMAYTKNNILVQAAQAMLAQANQVPQGVLQLLQ